MGEEVGHCGAVSFLGTFLYSFFFASFLSRSEDKLQWACSAQAQEAKQPQPEPSRSVSQSKSFLLSVVLLATLVLGMRTVTSMVVYIEHRRKSVTM